MLLSPEFAPEMAAIYGVYSGEDLLKSRAGKLIRGGVHLLSGRPQVLEVYASSALELGGDFALAEALSFGTLPKAAIALTEQSRRHFLKAAAQMSGKIINFASLARDVGADEKTIKSYCQNLEDRLVGRFLEPYHTSLRKRVSARPKFNLFDTGVQRALSRSLSLPVLEDTSVFGELFEAFFINKCFKLNHYYEREFSFLFLMTRDRVGIDLFIEGPGLPLLLEIKSATTIQSKHRSSRESIGAEFPDAERVCAARVTLPDTPGGVLVLPWSRALEE